MSDSELELRLYPAKRPGGVGTAKVPPCWAYIHAELRKKNTTKALLWKEYKAANGDRGYEYSAFSLGYRDWSRKLNLSMRQQHILGERCFVDFAGQAMPLINPITGEITWAQICSLNSPDVTVSRPKTFGSCGNFMSSIKTSQNSNRWLEKSVGPKIWSLWRAARMTWSANSICGPRLVSAGPKLFFSTKWVKRATKNTCSIRAALTRPPLRHFKPKPPWPSKILRIHFNHVFGHRFITRIQVSGEVHACVVKSRSDLSECSPDGFWVRRVRQLEKKARRGANDSSTSSFTRLESSAGLKINFQFACARFSL